jgi:Flp pilus assembly protein TadD
VDTFTDLLARGEAALDAGELGDAEALLRKATEREPTSPRAHNKLGVALARQGRHEEALVCFRRALELDPLHAPAYCNIGTVYAETGRLEEALAAYHKAVEVDPDYWVAHQNLAALYKRTGRYGEFVRHMKRATHLAARRPAGEGPARRPGCLVAALAAVALLWVSLT